MAAHPGFTAEADLEHDVSERPFGRESLFFVLPVPHEQLLGLAYAFKDGATGTWGYIVGFAGAVGGEPLHLDVGAELPLEGEDLHDFRVGPLQIRQPEPLQTAEVRYERDGVRLEVDVEALHRPVSWHENPDGCAAWAADDRYEQSVRTRGTFAVAGRTVQFESVGHRDHSWGPRDWRALQHWKWMNAATPDGSLSLHGWISNALGDVQVNGYVNRGGEVSPIVAASAQAELDDQLMHRHVTGSFTTEDGQTLELVADAVAGTSIPARHLRMHEIACTATLDGRPAIAHIELGWPASYVEDLLSAPLVR